MRNFDFEKNRRPLIGGGAQEEKDLVKSESALVEFINQQDFPEKDKNAFLRMAANCETVEEMVALKGLILNRLKKDT